MTDFSFTSPIICLPQKDIDTDMIIPAEYLKITHKEGLGAHLFENMKKVDPDFPVFDGPRILVAGRNFGCGSSREHASWALKDAGIDVVIASRFADIFRGNAEKNELLTIVLSEEEVQEVLEHKKPLSINLDRQEVVTDDGEVYKFSIPGFLKRKMLEGLSDLDYLLELRPTIREFASNVSG